MSDNASVGQLTREARRIKRRLSIVSDLEAIQKGREVHLTDHGRSWEATPIS